MIAEPQYPQKMTAEEYLEWEASRNFAMNMLTARF